MKIIIFVALQENQVHVNITGVESKPYITTIR